MQKCRNNKRGEKKKVFRWVAGLCSIQRAHMCCQAHRSFLVWHGLGAPSKWAETQKRLHPRAAPLSPVKRARLDHFKAPAFGGSGMRRYHSSLCNTSSQRRLLSHTVPLLSFWPQPHNWFCGKNVTENQVWEKKKRYEPCSIWNTRIGHFCFKSYQNM